MNFIKLIPIVVLATLVSISAQAQLTTGTVDFDVDTLHSMEQVAVALSDGSSLILVRDYVVDHTPNRYAWIGHVSSQSESMAVISVRGASAAGLIQTPSQVWKISLAGSTSVPVEELNLSELPNEADSKEDRFFSDGFEGTDLGTRAVAACDDPPSEIDVMVLYTDDAAAKSFDIEVEIDQAINLANRSFIVTDIVPTQPDGPPLKLNLVHTLEVQVNESSNSRFASEVNNLQENGDGFLDEIHGLRDQYNADLVVLITETGGACGRAYSTSVKTKNAFSIVRRDCINNQSFTHEVAHNFGAEHDRYALTVYGIPTYNPLNSNYGYSHINGSDSWRTIMAYNDECKKEVGGCPRLKFLSSPDNNYGGNPTGTNQTDNRNQLIGAASSLACYRDQYPTVFRETFQQYSEGDRLGLHRPEIGGYAQLTGELPIVDLGGGRKVLAVDNSLGDYVIAAYATAGEGGRFTIDYDFLIQGGDASDPLNIHAQSLTMRPIGNNFWLYFGSDRQLYLKEDKAGTQTQMVPLGLTWEASTWHHFQWVGDNRTNTLSLWVDSKAVILEKWTTLGEFDYLYHFSISSVASGTNTPMSAMIDNIEIKRSQ